MENVANEKRGQQGSDDLFLNRRLRCQVSSGSGEDEKIKKAHKGADVRELDDGHDGRLGQDIRRGSASWPWSLSVVSLGRSMRRRWE